MEWHPCNLLLLVLLLLPSSFADHSCRWTFDTCEESGGDFWSKCVAVLRRTCDSRQRRIRVHSLEGAPYFRFCTPWCSIRRTWCPWGEWSQPRPSCGRERDRIVFRRRTECCHPVTLRPDSRVPCTRDRYLERTGKNEQRKVVQCRPRIDGWRQLPAPRLRFPGYVTGHVVTLAGFLVFALAAVASFLLFRMYASRQFRAGRKAERRRRAVNVAVLTPINEPEPELDSDFPPPPYQESWRAERESDPPNYEAALRLLM